MKLKDAVRETVGEIAGLFSFVRIINLVKLLARSALVVSYVASGIVAIFGTLIWAVVPQEYVRHDIDYILMITWPLFLILGFVERVVHKMTEDR